MYNIYTREQMLALWADLTGVTRLFSSQLITDNDGLRTRTQWDIDCWYAHLLQHCPADFLPMEEVSALCTASYEGADAVRIILPSDVVRPVNLQLQNLSHEFDELDPQAYPQPDIKEIRRMQKYPLSAASPDDPVAVQLPGVIIIYGIPRGSLGPKPVVKYLLAVKRDSDRYIFRPEALQYSHPAAYLRENGNFNPLPRL